MAKIGQIRGLILEEFILHMLRNSGYRIITAEDKLPGTRPGKSGLEVEGRGEWHQVDALVAYDKTPAFVYPVRLIVAAKAYETKRPVGLPAIRNAVGVLKDLNENYFSFGMEEESIKIKRFNYVHAIFSLNGFSENAQRYAIAHQIFLIQYMHNPLFNPIQTSFKLFSPDGLDDQIRTKVDMSELRQALREYIKGGSDFYFPGIKQQMVEQLDQIFNEFKKIGGSYFGLLMGNIQFI